MSNSAADVDAASTSAQQLQKLPAAMVEEALILAEMFDLNEIAALQLLIKGKPVITHTFVCKWRLNIKTKRWLSTSRIFI